jgi:hypothetical protein
VRHLRPALLRLQNSDANATRAHLAASQRPERSNVRVGFVELPEEERHPREPGTGEPIDGGAGHARHAVAVDRGEPVVEIRKELGLSDGDARIGFAKRARAFELLFAELARSLATKNPGCLDARLDGQALCACTFGSVRRAKRALERFVEEG